MAGHQDEHGQRRDRLIEESVHDPYRAPGKPVEPTVCPECGAVFRSGRWQWSTEPVEPAETGLCPACLRTRDGVPAGILTLGGDFFSRHREEILRLVHNTVDTQKAEHPLKRIMDMTETPEGDLEIRFTDTHLPRGVGEAIARAYEGDLDIQYTKQAELIRVYWRR